MVKPVDKLLEWSIKNTKMRIKHGERHGMGDFTMHEKQILKKQERMKQLRLEKNAR